MKKTALRKCSPEPSEKETEKTFFRRFAPLFITQFLGAFNDNLFKSALLIAAAYASPEKSAVYTNVIAGLFILPFFLFSAVAGQIVAKYNRRQLTIILKIAELFLMLMVAVVYHFQNLPFLVLLLFLMGMQSTLFGPAKYALLPQLLQEKELIKGNAYTEGGTYLSIILGSVIGAAAPFPAVQLLLIVLSLAGLTAAWFIPDSPAPRPNTKISLNIWKDTGEMLSFIKKNKVIRRTIWGITWFWTVGAFCLTEIFPLASDIFNVTPQTVSFFLLLFSLGVGCGALISGKILKTRIDLFYVPLSSLIITLAGFLIYAFSIGAEASVKAIPLTNFILTVRGAALTVLFFVIALAGGLYVVPLNTLLQKTVSSGRLPQVIAGNNIINAFGMVLMAITAAFLAACGVSVPTLFLLLSIGNLAVAMYISYLYPRELVKSIFRVLLRLLFRVKCEGFENIRLTGSKVLVVSNHTSLLDGILIAAFMLKDICFAINTEWTHHPFIRIFRRIIDFYPIDTANPLSIRNLIGELNKNKIIMMFPEGRISVTGNLMKIFDGAGMVAYATNAEILPLRIDGALSSKFSYIQGLVKTRWFPSIRLQMLKPQRITVNNISSGVEKRKVIADTLYRIMRDMMAETEKNNENLFAALKQACTKYGNKKILEDGKRRPLTYRTLLKAAAKEASRIKKEKPQTKEIFIEPNAGTSAVIRLFAVWKLDRTAVISTHNIPGISYKKISDEKIILCIPSKNGTQTKQYTAQDLHRLWTGLYYSRGTNARDTFFSELSLDSEDGIVAGLLLPLMTGSRLFLNTARHGAGDLIYDTDSSVLCLSSLTSLRKFCNSGSRLDFYALRKVWFFKPEETPESIPDENDISLWLMRFGIKIKI